MSEKEKWQTRIGIAGLIVAVLGPAITLYIYNREDDSKREQIVWEDRKNTYDKLRDVMGDIAAQLDTENSISKESIKELSRVYWSKLPGNETSEIEREMIKFRNDLRDFEDGLILADKLKWRVQKISRLVQNELSSS